MASDRLTVRCLPPVIRRGRSRGSSQSAEALSFNLEAVQRDAILRAQTHFKGNISRMAEALGIGRNTLYAKLKKYEIVSIQK